MNKIFQLIETGLILRYEHYWAIVSEDYFVDICTRSNKIDNIIHSRLRIVGTPTIITSIYELKFI